jgi:hypothetical protein
MGNTERIRSVAPDTAWKQFPEGNNRAWSSLNRKKKIDRRWGNG